MAQLVNDENGFRKHDNSEVSLRFDCAKRLTIDERSAASLILKPPSEGFPQPGTRTLKFPDGKQLALGHTVGQRQSQNLNSRPAFIEALQPEPTLTSQQLCAKFCSCTSAVFSTLRHTDWL